MVSYQAEPASWWPNGLGGYIKPDAYTLLIAGAVREHWWIEVDLATESLPTVRRKLETYLDFVRRGQLGPHGVQQRTRRFTRVVVKIVVSLLANFCRSSVAVT